MKKARKPNCPAGYELEYSEKHNVWRFRKRFRYKDQYGNSKQKRTKWHETTEACDQEADETINRYKSGLVVDEDLTIATALKLWINQLEKEIKVADQSSQKDTTSKNTSLTTKPLLTTYTPNDILSIKIYDLQGVHFKRWLTYINSSTEDHDDLSGKSVKRYRDNLNNFNNYLETNGFISEQKAIEIETALKRVKVKPDSYGAKQIYVPTIQDLRKITKNLESKWSLFADFNVFYKYTLIQFLFYTGLETGELISLRWDDVAWGKGESGETIIYIMNSINEKENKDNVYKRIEASNLMPKNEYRTREISVWSIYEQLLQDYYRQYHYHYQVSYEEMRFCFVFPQIKDPHKFLPHKTIYNWVVDMCKEAGLPKTNVLAFRHSCAYYLCYERGMSYEEAHDYFGHSDSEMLRKVYAKFNQTEKRKRVNRSTAISELIKKKDGDKDQIYDPSLLKMIPGDYQDEAIFKARYRREWAQIQKKLMNIPFDRENVYYVDQNNSDVVKKILEDHQESIQGLTFIYEQDDD